VNGFRKLSCKDYKFRFPTRRGTAKEFRRLRSALTRPLHPETASGRLVPSLLMNKTKNTKILSSKRMISDELVARRPLPGMIVPSGLSFSPCQRFLAFLFPDSSESLSARQLYCMRVRPEGEIGPLKKLWDPSEIPSDAELSLEEQLRRERSRQMSLGVTQFSWALLATQETATVSRIMIPLNGDVFVLDVNDVKQTNATMVFDKKSTPMADDDATGGAIDPQISPNGKVVGFVRQNELYVLDIDKNNETAPRRLTTGSRHNGKSSGLADFIAQEEMDRYHGFWWSHDSKMVAFEEVDESHVQEFKIVHQGTSEVMQESHRYPFSGKANAKVRLGVVDVSGTGSVSWLDLSLDGESEDIYLARVDWNPDGSLCAQVENREQSILVLFHFNLESGKRTELVHEKSDVWINLHNFYTSFESAAGERALRIAANADPQSNMETGDGVSTVKTLARLRSAEPVKGLFFIWGSERDGFMHLYLYHFNYEKGTSTLVRPLYKRGKWVAISLLQLDIDRGFLYFSGTRESSLERHVYRCPIWAEGGSEMEPLKVQAEPGMNSMVFDASCSFVVGTHHSLTSEPRSALFKLKASGEDISLERVMVLHAGKESPLLCNELPRIMSLLCCPEPIFLKSSDKEADLFGVLYRPSSGKHGEGPYPLIVAVYGGPHVQRVTNGWDVTSDMRAQRLAESGYAVLKVDNRGSAHRGLQFEGAIKYDMGNLEVDDQVAGVRHLVGMGVADPKRVGIYGWSYGGYMSAMCLFKRSDIFSVAVSGAPVTHWDGYDTHYTERYMGTTESNPKGYETSAVMAHVDSFNGKLMIVHGLIDENVHFRHTARLINALISSRKTYDLLLFPDERHSPRRLQDRIYMEKRIKEYFDEHLKA